MHETNLLRTPTADEQSSAQITSFSRWLTDRYSVKLTDYDDLWQWSIDHLEEFWGSVWEYFTGQQQPDTVLLGDRMPEYRWFPGVETNLAGMILQHQPADEHVSLIGLDEQGRRVEVTGAELHEQVRRLAGSLRELGVQQGDVVACYAPNLPQTMISALAVTSLGAVWSGVGQDYQAQAVIDRFEQLRPKVLITADGYCWNGAEVSRTEAIAEIRGGITSIEHVICINHLSSSPVPDTLDWHELATKGPIVDPVPLEFNTALWVLYSSGTTGLPKGIVHSHGGVTIEAIKSLHLHTDMRADDTLFWWTSPSWMMWNTCLTAMLTGGTVVCYDGAPAYPAPTHLFKVANETGTTLLGLAPGLLDTLMKLDAPISTLAPESLRAVLVTGSPLAPATHAWTIKQLDVPVHSTSGGTDVVCGFAGGVANRPIWAGELSVRNLGVAVESWNEEGNPLINEVGEMVVTKPMPSMPIRFWGDPQGARYRAAYFDMFPGRWRHGDWMTVTDHGSVIVHGRSDSTLNRGGVRIGSSDIYRVVEQLSEISQSMVVGAEMPDGSYWMPLFVVLAEGAELSNELTDQVRDRIRREVSPRHVPDEIIVVPGLPHTRTGTRLEVPIKRILQGVTPSEAVQRSAVDNPRLLEPFIKLARLRHGH